MLLPTMTMAGEIAARMKEECGGGMCRPLLAPR
jgi:hypothetical protein